MKAPLELHNPGPHIDLATRLFASLRLCFTCDFYSFNEWTDKKPEMAIRDAKRQARGTQRSTAVCLFKRSSRRRRSGFRR
jgi:hypothetical protein